MFRQKWTKPLTPHPVTSEWTDVNPRRAGQLAALKQGPPSDESADQGNGRQASDNGRNRVLRESHVAWQLLLP